MLTCWWWKKPFPRPLHPNARRASLWWSNYYGWWKKSCTTWHIKNLANHVSPGFLPSTVSLSLCIFACSGGRKVAEADGNFQRIRSSKWFKIRKRGRACFMQPSIRRVCTWFCSLGLTGRYRGLFGKFENSLMVEGVRPFATGFFRVLSTCLTLFF